MKGFLLWMVTALALPVMAAPVVRTFSPALQASGPGAETVAWDVDGDGVTDLTARRLFIATMDIPPSIHNEWTGVVPRAGFELLNSGLPPAHQIKALNLPATVGPVPSQGTWTQATVDDWGYSLGGFNRSRYNPPVSTGILAQSREPYVAFRILKNGRYHYGVLDSRVPAAPAPAPAGNAGSVPPPPAPSLDNAQPVAVDETQFGGVSIPSLGSLLSPSAASAIFTSSSSVLLIQPPLLVSTPIGVVSAGPAVAFYASIIESEPDTPVVVQGLPLVIRNQGGISLPDGTTTSFGTLDLGGLRGHTYTITNESLASVSLPSLSMEGPDAGDFVVEVPSATSLASGQSVSLTVTYAPTTAGKTSNASLTLSDSNLPNSPFDILLTGTGGTATIAVKVEEVGGSAFPSDNAGVPFDLGSPAIGNASYKTFRITNLGSAPLRSLSAAVDDPWYYYGYPWLGDYTYGTIWRGSWYNYQVPSGFRAVSPVGYGDLAPGASRDFQVQWWPTMTISYTRNVILSASNMTGGTFNIPVTGAGSAFVPPANRLGGLHYRLGESYQVPGSVQYPLYGKADMTSTELQRWLQPEPVSQNVTTSQASSLSQAQVVIGIPAFLRISYPFEPEVSAPELTPVNGESLPKFATVSGQGSAASTLGSTTGVQFSQGSYLRNARMQLPGVMNNIAVECWFKADSITGAQCLTAMGSSTDKIFGLYLQNDRLQGRAGDVTVTSSTPVTAGTWHHAAWVVHSGTATLYLDQLNVGKSLREVLMQDQVLGLGVGATVAGSDPFNGTLDELRWFEVPVSGFQPDSGLLATAPPVSSVSETSVSFGTQIMGAAYAQKTTQLSNQGPGWLAIEKAELTGLNPEDFTVYGRNLYPLDTPAGLQSLEPLLIIAGDLNPLPPQVQVASSLEPRRKLLLQVTFKPSATGLRTAKLRLTTNDPVRPVYEITLAGTGAAARPEIEVSPLDFAWGSLLVGEARDYSVQVYNNGSQHLTVSSVNFTGPGAEDLALLNPLPLDEGFGILPGSSQAFTIRLHIKAAGTRFARMLIASNDADENPVEVVFHGRATVPEPDIQLYTQNTSSSSGRSSIASGATFAASPALSGGGSSTFYLWVHNSGTADLNNLSLSFEGANASDFAADSTLNETIYLGGNEQALLCTFTPGGLGARTATLRITSNDPDESPYLVTLTGEGLPPAPVLKVIDRGVEIASNAGFLRMGTAVIGGQAVTKPLRVRNGGTSPLLITSAGFSGPHASAFSVASLPGAIQPGAEADVVVSFSPAQIGPCGGLLTLVANGAQGSPYQIAVGGTGAYGSQSTLTIPPLPGWIGTALLELPNGNVLAAGYIEIEEVKTSRLREFQPDGSETPRFASFSIDGEINAIAVQADEAVIIAGTMGVKRVLASGQGLDASFTPPSGDLVARAVVALPSGKVLAGGSGSLGSRANLVRLNADGSLDSTFTLPAPDGVVNALALQDDGKVLVGGEFTNLGYDSWPNPVEPEFPLTGTLTLGPQTPHTGLFRLTATGSTDPTFANLGFHKVTALAVRGNRIAVTGSETRYNFIINYGITIGFGTVITSQTSGALQTSQGTASTSSSLGIYSPGWPVPSPYNQNVARLLSSRGSLLASQDLYLAPVAVALQPGDRMLVTPGTSYASPITGKPSVALIQPYNAPVEWYGLKGDGIAPAERASNTYYQLRHQYFTGMPRALLAQADGKVLLAGNPHTANILPTGGYVYNAASEIPAGDLSELYDDSPIPDPVPVFGLVQLDIDGFFHHTGLSVVYELGAAQTAELSDGLSTLSFGDGSQAINLLIAPNVATEAATTPSFTIDGPSAADFSAQVVATESGHRLSIRASVPSPGLRRAVLHLKADAGSDSFDIALESGDGSVLPPGLIVVDGLTGEELSSGDDVAFPAIDVGDREIRSLLILNTRNQPLPSPLQVQLSGEHVQDFKAATVGLPTLVADGSLRCNLTFEPSDNGPRNARLTISMSGRQGLPFIIHLRGAGKGLPVIAIQPQDSLVAAGSSLNLTVGAISEAPVSWQWFKEGKRLPGRTSSTLVIASARLVDAGIYTVQGTSRGRKVMSSPARVGVLDMKPRTLQVGENYAVHMPSIVAGPDLSYRWARNDTFLTNDSRISGATAASLVLRSVTLGDEGFYTCTVQLGNAVLKSAAIDLKVTPRPTFASVSGFENWRLGIPVTASLLAGPNVKRYSALGLPPGVKLNPVTGIVSGRPAAAGTYTVQLVASNAAGQSLPYSIAVTVAQLPPGFVGTFNGLLERSELNGYLGGTWTMVVSPIGAYTAKLRMGSPTVVPASAKKQKAGTAAAAIRGGIVEHSFVGMLNAPIPEADPTVQWTVDSETTSPGGLTATFVLNAGWRTGQVTASSLGGLYTAGEGMKSGKLAFPQAAGSFRGYLQEFFGPGGDVILGDAQGAVTTSVNRNGAAVWTIKISTEKGAPVITGSGQVDADGYQARIFALLPDADGGRSLSGGLMYPSDVESDYMAGGFSWGNRDPFTTETPPGTELHHYMIDGLRVK